MTGMDIGADDALYFLPLGGTGEIGMNCYLYGTGGQWLMVDLGVSFGDETTPGIDVVMPDLAFIEERRERLAGLVLTHAHEDHFGAVQYLWSRLRCPVYATPFTAEFLRLKLRESAFDDEVELVEVPLSGTVTIGRFEVEFITVAHSIPEPNALAIRTRRGVVLHSGDWKLDPRPQIGDVTNATRLRELGSEGVLALVCDSTNALVPGQSGSEADVEESLKQVIAAQPNRVAVTCFATNVARIQSVARAAHANGRHTALIGRSLWRVHEAARATGYLDGMPEPFVTEHEAGYLPRDKVVLVCTGSQGEPRSALARIARNDHPQIVLEAGDTVIFSARPIPGNEKAIGQVENDLVKLGVGIITPSDALVHVSGHPARDELAAMYQWVRPRIAVPVHGEPRHLDEHARFAREHQVGQVVVPEDGALVRLAPGPAEIVERVHAGRLGTDGTRIVPLDGEVLRHRRRMTENGAVVATLVLDRRGELAADPQVALLGLEEQDEELADYREALAEDIRVAVEDLPRPRRSEDETVREAARLTIRRAIKRWHGKKPVTQVQLVRL